MKGSRMLESISYGYEYICTIKRSIFDSYPSVPILFISTFPSFSVGFSFQNFFLKKKSKRRIFSLFFKWQYLNVQFAFTVLKIFHSLIRRLIFLLTLLYLPLFFNDKDGYIGIFINLSDYIFILKIIILWHLYNTLSIIVMICIIFFIYMIYYLD